MEIRAEKLKDIAAVRSVNIEAFGRKYEADLVDRLRGVDYTFSFVAVESEKIVGHIFFSPVEIERKCTDNLFILGLAPVAILPSHQRQGIGSLLIRYGLEACLRSGCKAVVVLGNPEYYSRFGFICAREKGFKCEYKVPDEAFMILELENDALARCSGIIKYRSEFKECE
jgi:putative acetyltransferase